MPTEVNQKRLNLVLPEPLYDKLQEVAKTRHTTLQNLIRKFLKLGLIAVNLEDSPDAELLIREGGVERRILIL